MLKIFEQAAAQWNLLAGLPGNRLRVSDLAFQGHVPRHAEQNSRENRSSELIH